MQQLTRAQMKALPMDVLTSSFARTGDLTVLAFARQTRYVDKLYERMPVLRKYWRSVREDPVRATMVEGVIRAVWSRLVDRSRGYFLNGRGEQQYADA